MPLALLRPPPVEPVSLSDAKAHCRIDTDADDGLVQSLVVTSRLHIEAALGLALVSQGWRQTRDTWPPAGAVRLRPRPVARIEAIRIRIDGGTTLPVDMAELRIDRADDGSAVLAPRRSREWPALPAAASTIEIDLEAGYGPAAADVPAPIRQALLMLVAHWYENREAGPGDPRAAPPPAVSALLAPYRRVAL